MTVESALEAVLDRMQREERPSISFELTGAELTRMFGRVLPHAATDVDPDAVAAEPLLYVHIEATPERLRLMATDRFTMAVTTWELEYLLAGDDSAPFTLALRAAPLASTLATLDADETYTLTLTGDAYGSIDDGGSSGLTIRHPSGLSVHLSSVARVPINWRSVLAPALAAPQTLDESGILVNPHYLARFATAADGGGTPLVMRPAGVGKPIIITCGDHFLGAVMPMTPSDDARLDIDSALTYWRSICRRAADR